MSSSGRPGGAAAAVFEIPHACDLSCAVAAAAEQVFRLPFEGAPAPAVAAAGAVLVGELHGMPVNAPLGRRERDQTVVREELPRLADRDVVRIGRDLRNAAVGHERAYLRDVVLEVHRRAA